jgi:uncharacterized protein (TIGR02099 family)
MAETNNKLKHVKHVSKRIYYLSVIVSFFSLLLILALVWLSNAVSERRDEAAQWVSQQLGYPVTIGEIELYLFDLTPKLHLRNVHVLDEHKSMAVLSLNHIYIGLDLVESLKQRQAVLSKATLTEVTAHVIHDEQAVFRLQGLDKIMAKNQTLNQHKFESPIQKFEMREVAFAYYDEVNPQLNGNYLVMSGAFGFSQPGYFEANGNVALPSHLGQYVALSATGKLSEQGDNLERWQAEITSKDIELSTLSEFDLIDDVAIESGSASCDFSVVAEQQHVTATGKVQLNDMLITGARKGQASTNIHSLEADISLSKSAQNWTANVNNIQLNIDQETWQADTIEVSGNTSEHYQIKANHLNLDSLSPLIGLANTEPKFEKLALKGDVNDLKLSFSTEQGVTDLTMAVQYAAISGLEGIPAVTGVSAEFTWRNNQGTVQFNSTDLTIDASPQLNEVVKLDYIQGELTALKQHDKWSFSAQGLAVKNDDFALVINGEVEQTASAVIPDISVELADVNVANWKKYVPIHILSDDFRKWSNTAFRQGQIQKGLIELSGDLAEFPYIKPEQTGEFLLDLTVTDFQLDYGVGWPHLKQVEATIKGNGKRLVVEGDKGVIGGLSFKHVRTEIDNYLVSKPVLTAIGQVEGSSQTALGFLKSSPLNERFGQIATSFSAEGKTRVNIDLNVPLTNVNSATATGSIEFEDSQLKSSDDIDIEITAINGRLLFDGDGVSGKGINARFLKQPIKIDVKPAKGMTLIEATGEMKVATIGQKWPELQADFINGQAAFKTTVSVTEQQRGVFNLAVNVGSRLKGVVIDVPAPYGKVAAEERDLAIEITEHENGELAYRINYDDDISGFLIPTDESLVGEIRLGAKKASPSAIGLALKGYIPRLNVADWQQWQQRQPSSGDKTMIDDFDMVSINVDQLNVANQKITHLALMAEKSAQEWRINLQSDQVKGRLQLPLPEQPNQAIIADLDYLHLRTATESTQPTSQTPQRSALWPSVKFASKDVRFDDMTLGEVNFIATRSENAWTIDSLTLLANSFIGKGHGRWLQTATNEQSEFELVVTTDDLETALADLGYQRVIEAKKSAGTLKVSWSGGPTNFATKLIRGKLDLNVGAGKMLEVEPGAAGRIFGLMSIAAIPRRLTLDFSDLFSKGFNFSSITGQFDFAAGIANTDNLIMNGDAAKIEVRGPVNLLKREYDQTVTVTPNVSSTLPVAGVVAGGPIGLGVGAAILLVDKIADDLFGKEIVNLVSYNYSLTGPWAEPELKTIQSVTE